MTFHEELAKLCAEWERYGASLEGDDCAKELRSLLSRHNPEVPAICPPLPHSWIERVAKEASMFNGSWACAFKAVEKVVEEYVKLASSVKPEVPASVEAARNATEVLMKNCGCAPPDEWINERLATDAEFANWQNRYDQACIEIDRLRSALAFSESQRAELERGTEELVRQLAEAKKGVGSNNSGASGGATVGVLPSSDASQIADNQIRTANPQMGKALPTPDSQLVERAAEKIAGATGAKLPWETCLAVARAILALQPAAIGYAVLTKSGCDIWGSFPTVEEAEHQRVDRTERGYLCKVVALIPSEEA